MYLAAQATSFISRLNGWHPGTISGAARLPLEAARRMFRAQTKKTRGFLQGQIERTVEALAVCISEVPYWRQWPA